ncbi:hypothetical protein J4461_02945 [Candidatus Pacearchaeota archaeon]|nr:hypothetical protein [Candidatus Pacearchaeota archaeon]
METTSNFLDIMHKDYEREVLSGKVWIQGTREEHANSISFRFTAPLYFNPALETSRCHDNRCFNILEVYLVDYKPIGNNTLLFFPSANFSLYSGKNHVSLYMWKEVKLKPIAALDVLNKRHLPPTLNNIIGFMQRDKDYSSVIGKIDEVRSYNDYLLLRRCFR